MTTATAKTTPSANTQAAGGKKPNKPRRGPRKPDATGATRSGNDNDGNNNQGNKKNGNKKNGNNNKGKNGQLGIKHLDGSSCGFISIPLQWDDQRSGLPQLESAYRIVEAVNNWYVELFDVVRKDRVQHLLADAKRRHAPLDVMLVLSEVDSLLVYWQNYADEARKEMGRIEAAALRLQEEQQQAAAPPYGDASGGGKKGGKKNGKKNGNNGNGNNGNGKKNGKNGNGKDGSGNKAGSVCRFMSVPYDDVKSPGSAYNRVDEAYEWYEEFFVAFDYDRLMRLEKAAPKVGAPESAAVALGMLRIVYGELQKRFVELHRERSRLYVLAMQEHTRSFVDSESRAVVKADVSNEATIRELFKEKKLASGSHIMVHRFMALTNRMLREAAYDFMVTASVGGEGAAPTIDETFRRLDYDPREDNFFVTFGGSDDITIKFSIQSSGYPDAHIGRGGIMPFSRFLNEHSNTIRIVDAAYEEVGEVLFDGRTMTRRAPSLRGRLQRPRFAQDGESGNRNKNRSYNNGDGGNNRRNNNDQDDGRGGFF
jgi:hypothetical protein